jgi:nucleotide-binding universal stress UspA family protein
MLERILVGTDASPEGRDAVVLGAAIAELAGAELTLIGGCYRHLIPSSGRFDRDSQLAELRRRINCDRDRYAPTARVEVTADDDAARVLRVNARRLRADLVVIGSSRRAPAGRCAIGRTGRHLLNETATALAIARRGLHQSAAQLSTIAVGYDGGAESVQALGLAEELAAATDAALVIDTIYEVPIPAFVLGEHGMHRDFEERRADERRGALAVAEQAVARTSPRSQLRVSVGTPGIELRRVSNGVDLIVIGSRRCGQFARLILGAAAETLIADCGTSLIIAGPGTANAANRSSAPADPRQRAHR